MEIDLHRAKTPKTSDDKANYKFFIWLGRKEQMAYSFTTQLVNVSDYLPLFFLINLFDIDIVFIIAFCS